jgi:ribose transport system permease protein
MTTHRAFETAGMKVALFWLIVVIAFMYCVWLKIPRFFTLSNLLNIIRQSSIAGIASIAMTMIIIIKCIDLSAGGLLAFVPMLCVVLSNARVPFILCVICAVVAGTAIGFLNGVITTKIGIPSFICTFVFGGITSGLALVMGSGGTVSGFPRYFTLIGNGKLLQIVPYSDIILIIFLLVGVFAMKKTTLGTYIYAIGDNESVLKNEGGNPDIVKILVFTIGGFYFSMAGLLLSAQLATVHPTQGGDYQLDIIAACIIGGCSMGGGSGKVQNSVIGSLALGGMRNILNLFRLHTFAQKLTMGAIIVTVVIISVFYKNIQLESQQRY